MERDGKVVRKLLGRLAEVNAARYPLFVVRFSLFAGRVDALEGKRRSLLTKNQAVRW